MYQRDVFLDLLYRRMGDDSSIYFLSADFGAPGLDKIREHFPNRFVHCGISEQAMIDIGTGLCLDGANVYCYAMAPFLSLRGIEQIKCGPAMMNLPMKLLSVGVGLGYADSGPTHYSNEDFAAISSIVNLDVYTASDCSSTEWIFDRTSANSRPAYVRLDRHPLEGLHSHPNCMGIDDGLRVFSNSRDVSVAFITHGRLVHECLKAHNEIPNSAVYELIGYSEGIMDKLCDQMKDVDTIFIADEQTPIGSLCSLVSTWLFKREIRPRRIVLKSIEPEYVFENGGRNHLLKKYSLDSMSLLKAVRDNC